MEIPVAQAMGRSRTIVSILTVPVYTEEDKAFRSAYVSGMREDELRKQIRIISEDYLVALTAEDWSDGLGDLARVENIRRATHADASFLSRLMGRISGRT